MMADAFTPEVSSSRKAEAPASSVPRMEKRETRQPNRARLRATFAATPPVLVATETGLEVPGRAPPSTRALRSETMPPMQAIVWLVWFILGSRFHEATVDSRALVRHKITAMISIN